VWTLVIFLNYFHSKLSKCSDHNELGSVGWVIFHFTSHFFCCGHEPRTSDSTWEDFLKIACGIAFTKACSSVSQPGIHRTLWGVLQEVSKCYKNSKFLANYHGNSWLAVVNTRVIRLHYQLPLCCVLVDVYLRLYLVVLCLFVRFVFLRSCLTIGDRKIPHRQLFLTCKYFHRWGLLGIWKIVLGVSPWNECWETLAYVVNKCREILPLEVYASISFSSRITCWWYCFE